MKHFGIIGYPLEHSQSAELFGKKFREEHIDAEYSLYPIEHIEEFAALRQRDFCGMNVTMPYKQAVIPYLDALDDTAREIGAVNVIRFQDGRLTGYNTDALGFMEAIRPLLLPTDRKALILGTGGAARAVRYGLTHLGLECQSVSRSPERGLTYDRLTPEVMRAHTVIVNATPLGMVPDTKRRPPIPYDLLTSAHLLMDCIYNPAETLFLREGRKRGCRTLNGEGMLRGQAVAAWRIWTPSGSPKGE